jgi:hypothetical protein
LQKSAVNINSKSGIFTDPLNFRKAETFYSIDGFSKHHNQSNLLIQYNGKFLKENEKFDKYYRFDSLKFISFTITDNKILEINFAKLKTLDLFFDHSPDGLFIGFIGN